MKEKETSNRNLIQNTEIEKLTLTAYWKLDYDRNIILFTDGMRNIFDVDDYRNEMPINDFYKLLGEKSVNTLDNMIDGIKKCEDEYFDLYFSITSKDKSEKKLLLRSFKERTDEQNLFCGIIQDITKQTNTISKLSRATNMYKELVKALPVVVYRAKVEGESKDSFISDKFLELTGYVPKKDFFFSKNREELVHKDDVQMLYAKFNEAYKNKAKNLSMDYRIITKTGEEKWVNDFLSFIEFEDGLYVQGTIKDITKERENLRVIEEKEKMLSKIFDNITDVVWVVDRNFKIKSLSKSGEKLLGYSEDYICKHKIEEIVTKDSDDLLYNNITTIIDNTSKNIIKENLDINIDFIHKNGKIINTEARMSILFDSNDCFDGVIGVTRDITEELIIKKKMSEMERINKINEKMTALGEMAGGIAHDFNNQIMTIIGYGDLIKKYTDNPKVNKYLDNLAVVCNNASELTQKLLDFSRRGRMISEELSLHEIIDGIIYLTKNTMGTDINIVKNYEANNDKILGDITQLNNAFLNIAINAREAMALKGKLYVTTSNFDSHKGFIRITIRDTGSGINPEILDKIFEPFFSTKKEKTNSGMGLASVFGTVKSHQGEVKAFNSDEGGAVIEICLPVIEKGKG